MDDKTCLICFEDMDMKAYKDNKESTQVCVKLECDHAFHTKCIVECLQKLNHKCPSCNTHKTPEQILTLDGTISELIDQVKRNKELKNELKDYNTSRKELELTIKILKNETSEFIKKRKQELLINEKRKVFNSSIRKVKNKFINICKSRGPIYYGAYKNIPMWRRNRLIFSENRRFYRLQHPYFCLRI